MVDERKKGTRDMNTIRMTLTATEVPISSRPAASRFRWLVLALIFVVFLVAGADRANIGVIVPVIKEEFKLTNTDIGAMASLFYLGYSTIQIPVGLLYERFGVRRILSFALFATSISTLFMGLATSALQLKACRIALGFAEGPINIGILTIINRWFPPAEKGTATGIFISSIKVAPAVVPPICALVIYYFGWREVFYFFSVPGLLLAVIWFIFVQDNPRDSRFCSAAELTTIEDTHTKETGKIPVHRMSMPLLDRLIRAKRMQPLSSNAAVLRSWDVWGCAIGYSFMVGIVYAIMTWVPTYLVNVKKFPLFEMGFVASTPWIGAIIGNVVGGLLSDRVLGARRKPLMILTSASTIVMMYLLIYAPANPWLLSGLFILTGILLSLGYSTFLVYPMGLVTKEKIPFAASIVNTGGSLGGAFSPFVVGLILDSFNWDAVFLFLAFTSLLTFLVVLSIIEPVTAEAE